MDDLFSGRAAGGDRELYDRPRSMGGGVVSFLT